MDEVTQNAEGDIPLCMLFIDDVVLGEQTRMGVTRKLELWMLKYICELPLSISLDFWMRCLVHEA